MNLCDEAFDKLGTAMRKFGRNPSSYGHYDLNKEQVNAKKAEMVAHAMTN